MKIRQIVFFQICLTCFETLVLITWIALPILFFPLRWKKMKIVIDAVKEFLIINYKKLSILYFTSFSISPGDPTSLYKNPVCRNKETSSFLIHKLGIRSQSNSKRRIHVSFIKFVTCIERKFCITDIGKFWEFSCKQN